jgi:conjugative relaxase-like TrwC/TraI family protein
MMTVQTVSAGMATTYYNKDNYYTKDLSSLDSWQGAISKKLDLEGKKIEPQIFDNFIKKMTERNGGNDNKKRVGIDLTFSCPKSISLAMAKDDETKKDMLEAEQKAIKEALEEIEKNGGFTFRTTKNKVTTEHEADNLLIGKFNHFVNRNGELDLHTHCVVFNLTEKDGKEYSLNAKKILKKQTEWGLLFRQKMAKNLQAKGYKLTITDSKKGLFELAGFDRETIEKYSSRRLEILKKMEADGTAGSREAMKANLQTRKTKKQVDLDKIYDKVRQEIFANEKVKILKGRAKKNYYLVEQKKIADKVVDELERETFAFTKDQLKKRIMSAGVLQNIDEKRAEKLINENEKLVNLGNKELENGTIKQFFTTEKNINIEDNIIAKMNQEKGTIKTALSEEKSEKLLDEICKNGGYTPNQEQVNAIHHILTNKDRIVGVQGLAGTGKTYSFTLVKKMADRENIEVKGICFTGKASEGLQADSGIESTTIHSFLNKLEKDSGIDSGIKQKTTEGIKQDWDLSKVKPAGKKQIWVVDEAGLVDNRMMNYLIEASIKADAKLVLTGDYQQLPPVGAGEPMKNLIDNGMATAYMEDIRRQKDIELLNAVKESVKGDTLNTYKILEQKNAYHEIADREKLQNEIIKKVTNIKQDELKENLLLVQTNADRKNYNDKIQKVFIEQGRLTIGNTFKIENSEGRQERRKIYEGDRIVLLANDSMCFREIKGGLGYTKTKVNNGTMGTVKRVENDKIVVSLDNGKMVYFSPQKYKKFDLAYAVTNYKAQGMTVKNCIVDMTTKGKSNNRNALYVNISRAKFKAEVYTDDKKKLEKQTLNFAKKINSEDFREQIASYKRAKLQNTNYVPADERAIKKLEADFEAKEVPKKEDYQLEKENIEEKAQCLAQNLAPKQKQPKVITRKMIHEMNKKAQNKDQERSRYLGR